MKKMGRKKFWSTLVLMICLVFCTNSTTQAQTLKEKALTAYKVALETRYFDDIYGDGQKYMADSFYLMDLDGDSVPELFVKAYFQAGIKGYAVYACRNESVQRIGTMGGGESVTQVSFYKNAKMLREDWTRWGRTVRWFYKIRELKLERILGCWKADQGSMRYFSNGTEITNQEYASLVKQEEGAETAVDVEKILIKNTPANRTKYLSVKSKKPSIKLNKSSATITLGGKASVQLKATISGIKGNVTWSSKNSKIASVSKSGKVTGKRAGSTVITAKAGKYTTKCKITVRKKKTAKKTAMDLYRKLLEKGKFDSTEGKGSAYGFYLFDLDGNGVKEILITRGKVCYLYTCRQNKAVRLLARGGWGGSKWMYYKKKHVLLFEQGGAGIHEKTYYAIKNGKIVDVAHNSYDYNVNKHYYERNGKKTTKKKIEAYERQLNKEKPVTLEPNIGIAGKGFRKNTAANRKRYLK